MAKSTERIRRGGVGEKSLPLESLICFDQLEVGPVRLQPRKLQAEYRLIRGRYSQAATLEYSWEEDVFKPGEEADVNLGGLIAAQVAINYGLFCGNIVFRGTYDPDDRRFIRTMAEPPPITTAQ